MFKLGISKACYWLRGLDLNQRPSGYEPVGRTSQNPTKSAISTPLVSSFREYNNPFGNKNNYTTTTLLLFVTLTLTSCAENIPHDASVVMHSACLKCGGK